MKEKLDPENRVAIVNYHLERAYETLKARSRAEAFVHAMENLTREKE